MHPKQNIWNSGIVNNVDLKLINNIYKKEIKCDKSNKKSISNLELSQYLENYLWPNFNHDIKQNHISYLMSIIVMINEKYKENVDIWEYLSNDVEKFSYFFDQITRLSLDKSSISIKERLWVLIFLINVIARLEVDLVRKQLSKYISPAILLNISEVKQKEECEKFPKLKKYFNQLKNKDSKLTDDQIKCVNFERTYLIKYIENFFEILKCIPSEETEWNIDDKNSTLCFCERFIEFLIDLNSVSQTRRFFNPILEDNHVLTICEKSNLSKRKTEGKLFVQMLEILKFYIRFEINHKTGCELSPKEIFMKHYNKLFTFQKIIFKNFSDHKDLYLKSISQIDNKKSLFFYLKNFSNEQLVLLAATLNLGRKEVLEKMEQDLIIEIIVFHHEKYKTQLDNINELPLYPTEEIIWNENLVPSQYYDSEKCLALPKLNLQFLTLQDYLIRNFHLFRLESTFEIKQDIENSIFRMKPWKSENHELTFGGWSRMSLPINEFIITEIGQPKLDTKIPSKVKAEIKVALSVRNEIKKEWQNLKKHDVCFLITIIPKCPIGKIFNFKDSFCDQVGLTIVRGCEIEGMLNSNGKLITEFSNESYQFENDFRTYKVWLDPNQYAEDINSDKGKIYESFNILLRRKPKENNFKAVLETIKDLINTKFVVPEWLHDILLGYGQPSSAHYSELDNNIEIIDFGDTFLNLDHLQKAFPHSKLILNDSKKSLVPPFKLKFSDFNKKEINVFPSKKNTYDPYLFNHHKLNTIEFTDTQTEAIYSGLQNGLTLIVGPPGTGKTDVAVQIVSNIYHNWPNQRTLIVTHSNQALNQIFEKLINLNIDERHLLRLGHGEENLETSKDFSRYGRVNYVLNKRMELLDLVTKLAKSLNNLTDAGYTCETASYYFMFHIVYKFEQFIEKIQNSEKTKEVVEKFFPFTSFFDDAEQPIFKGETFEENMNIANGCYKYIKKIFTQLEEFRSFEMLRSNYERSNYLLIKEAKIIAMTCTHAALKRKELIEIGFHYDNILMEEAAQILEIETFIPFLLQNPEHGHNRLKRWIMIGDHNQLPPIIKNTAFQKYGNMEQSLFKRFIRLGVPKIDLDAQGRCRFSICSLFRWKYKNLKDLPIITSKEEYLKANAGFVFDYQFVNVEDFNNKGESEPMPYFYQNLAEAEFVVATFMYMRLLGYPAEKITILTTYNGQKHLIRDVIQQRCASNCFIGCPNKVTTVDKFQGMQNDYILLSLVRTKNIGHIRDVRRLIVAMSRARLGLYIFGRYNLFQNCLELKPVISILSKRPNDLCLINQETYPTNRLVDEVDTLKEYKTINDMQEMVKFIYEFYEQKLNYWKVNNPEFLESILKTKLQESENEEYEVIEVIEEDHEKSEVKEINQEEESLEVGFIKISENDKGIDKNDEDFLNDLE